MSIAISQNACARAPDCSSAPSSAELSPEERLLALFVYTQSSQMDGAKTSIDLNAEQLEKLREQVKKALEQARDAKKHSGFWGGLAKILGGDVATLASAVAAVAAVVATGGAAAAVLAVVAAAATFAESHAKELGIPTEIALAIAVTASVAGLICGNAKGLLDVGKGVKTVAEAVKVGGNVAAGVAKAGGGAFGIVSGAFDRDAGYARADARSAQGRQDLVTADMDEAFDFLADAIDRQNSAAQLTRGIQQRSSASADAILNNWGGAA